MIKSIIEFFDGGKRVTPGRWSDSRQKGVLSITTTCLPTRSGQVESQTPYKSQITEGVWRYTVPWRENLDV